MLFVATYVLVVLEETVQMRKSAPVMLAAGPIWVLIGVAFTLNDQPELAQERALQIIEEYGELFLFLLVAITYVDMLEERRAFEVLRGALVGLWLSYRQLFLLTGVIALFLSSVLENLTTPMVMGAVVLALGRDANGGLGPRFVALSCISVVLAANARGFQPVWRYHHPDGLAEGQAGIL